MCEKVIFAATLLCSVCLSAQELTTLNRGDKVRLSAPSIAEEVITGRFVAVKADTLYLSHSDLKNIPLSSIAKLEVSTAQKSRALRGNGIGLLLGGVAGAFYGEGGHPGLPHRDDVPPKLEYSFQAAILGGLIGGMVGARNPADTWQEIPIE